MNELVLRIIWLPNPPPIATLSSVGSSKLTSCEALLDGGQHEPPSLNGTQSPC